MLSTGLPGPTEQKMPNHLQKMSNRFKKCQTSWNRMNAVVLILPDEFW